MEEIQNAGDEAAQEKGQIRLDQSTADTSYSNFLLVSTAAEEFVLTFGIHMSEENTVKVGNRVILSPKNAKRLLAALSQGVKLYEDKLGTIDIKPAGAAAGDSQQQ